MPASWGVWVYRALAHVPCHFVSLRAGHQHPAQLLRGPRRRRTRGHSHQGLELLRGSVENQDSSSSTRPARSRRVCSRSRACTTARWRTARLLEYAGTRRVRILSTPSARACKRPAGVELDRSRVSDIEERGGPRRGRGRGTATAWPRGNGQAHGELGVKCRSAARRHDRATWRSTASTPAIS